MTMNAPVQTLFGSSAPMMALRSMLDACAASPASVLIQGETGSGKEVICRELHRRSDRASQPFVAINCAAIPAALLESELFGHRKGAFTGALSDRIGRLERADGGTLFLDEIGDMPLDLQVKLLRVLEERTVEPLGGGEVRQIDVRVVAATHRDLPAMVARGEFREDLYYRLNVIPLTIPALRERAADIPDFCAHFAKLHSQGKAPVSFTSRSLDVLKRYQWPGNVRELSNLMMRFSVLFPGRRIDLTQVPAAAMPEALAALVADCLPPLESAAAVAADVPAGPAEALEVDFMEAIEADLNAGRVEDLLRVSRGIRELPDQGIEARQILQDLETNFIRIALTQARGNVSKAATLLNLQRTTLIQKISRYNLGDTGYALCGCDS